MDGNRTLLGSEAPPMNVRISTRRTCIVRTDTFYCVNELVIWSIRCLVAYVRETVVDVKKTVTTGQLQAHFEPCG